MSSPRTRSGKIVERFDISRLRSSIPILALLALLAVLATLQVRWLEQMRVADHERTRADLEARLQRVADDFNRQLGNLFVELQPLRQRGWSGLDGGQEKLPQVIDDLLSGWREKANDPEIVAATYLIGPSSIGPSSIAPSATAGGRGRPEGMPPALPGAVWRLDPVERWSAERLPDGLQHTAATLASSFFDRPRRGDGDGNPSVARDRDPAENGSTVLLAQIPALLIPLALPPSRFATRTEANRADGEELEGRERRIRRRGSRRSQIFFVAVVLDRHALLEEMLPALVDRAFGPDPGYRLRVVDRQTGAPVVAFGPKTPEDASVDARTEIFGPLSLDRSSRLRGRGRGSRPPFDIRGLDQGRWWLEASHPAGSLTSAIAGAHRRNLAISLGILAILAASLILLVRGAARSRRLARQQIDFVAGITHELMTPLAALRSAGQNLADGVVQEEKQVQRYGRMIDREGQRLGDMVGQVLAFSRMQSGQPNFHPTPLDAAGEVTAVLDEMAPTLEAAGIEVALEIDPGIDELKVLADSQALRRALANLISNAVKYGQPSSPQSPGATPWIGVRLSPEGPESEWIRFEIADRGPGISAQDRPHLFEPFYRGQGLAASRVPGSGLGLALVRHLVAGQGGRIDISAAKSHSVETPGAVFTIDLPAAPAPAAIRGEK